ncbi:MAG TPA: toll/interleukin-1 receptor domain-containing protein [Puia sp.]|nr:toll/interleukin-1 receptor domain-containing protein [Puia sp.]
MDHQIFISYAQPDKDQAYAVHEAIHNSGLISWIAPDSHYGIAAGEFFEDSIVTAIQSCRIFVLIYSIHCNRSRFVPIEIRIAFEKRKEIIPFRLDHSDVSNNILLSYLNGIQYIDATEKDRQDARNKLIIRLHDLLKKPGYRQGTRDTTENILLNEGIKLLKMKCYIDAHKKLQTCVDVMPENMEARFYLALAVIAGKKARKLDGLVVRRLEGILQPGIGLPEYGYTGILLALIKYGYYRMNGLRDGFPTVEELLEHNAITPEKAKDVLSLMDDPENPIWMELKNLYKH